MELVNLYTKNIHHKIKEDILHSSTIYILSSFIMKSGVEVIYDALKEAVQRGADIKILTGDYLYITQPAALAKLLELENANIEIRLWQSKGISFHPKSFIFKHREDGALIVGSSNLSRSALTRGVEWNVRMKRKAAASTFDKAIDQYIQLFYADHTMPLNKETLLIYDKAYHSFHKKHVDLLQTWTKREEIALTLPVDEDERIAKVSKEPEVTYKTKIEPRPAQAAALLALEETVAEQYDKAMVVMATGLGKTFLAAFFARKFHKILFVAHREEILKQAKNSFELVLDQQASLYYGKEKDRKTNMVFASIYTLSVQEHLHSFAKNEFDLIIVDEFHHAAATSYQKLLNYFTPEFLLGLTATPERTDGKDVFALCDGNVAYQISFVEAIQKGWLAPFQYYGIKDHIDYSNITWLGARYEGEALLKAQINEQRAAYIFKQWQIYKQTRTIGFCSSIEQAQFLSDYFIRKNVHAICLTSHTKPEIRKSAISKLTRNDIDIIFTVDLFNEGVDIPAVDTLLFTRPTESLVVFTQQLGRGLRKHDGKSHCVIIDLIGNYRNADIKLQVFAGEEMEKRQDLIPELPPYCKIELETDVVNLLQEMNRKRSPRKERLYNDYLFVKQKLGRRPTYREVHLYGNENAKEYRQAYGGYFAFLFAQDELTKVEQDVYDIYYHWLNKVEKEVMTKSYKMVVLQYLLEKGATKWYEPVTPKEVAPFFHHFYMSKNYRKQIDFSNKNTKRLWKYDEGKTAKLIANMPMSKWVGKDNLVQFDGTYFSINFDIKQEAEDILHMMTRQICEYKMHIYFERKGHQI